MTFPLTLIKVSLNPQFGKLLIEREFAYWAFFFFFLENSYNKRVLQLYSKIQLCSTFAEIAYRSTLKKWAVPTIMIFIS